MRILDLLPLVVGFNDTLITWRYLFIENVGMVVFWPGNGGISQIASREDNSSNGRFRRDGVESDDADLDSLYTNHSRSHEQGTYNSAALVSSLVLHVPYSWIERE